MFRELAHDDDLMHRILLLAAAPEVAALLREHPAFRNLPQSWQARLLLTLSSLVGKSTRIFGISLKKF